MKVTLLLTISYQGYLTNTCICHYLQELLKKYTPARNLRSSQKNLLECPVLGTRFYGEHAFSFGGPLLWNAVSLLFKEANSVNNLKSLLKTFLFQEYYN